MNILLVRNIFIKNVHYTSCEFQLIKSFTKMGHNVKMIGIDDENKHLNDLILLKAPFNKRRFYLIKLTFYLPAYCIKHKIDIVIVDNRSVLATFGLLLIKKIFRIKIFEDVRSIPVEQSMPRDYKLSSIISNYFYNGITFITAGTQSYLEKMIGRKYKKTALFPSAVNPILFSPGITNNIPVKIKEKIKERIVIFYHGSISPNRGVNLVLDAFNKLHKTHPELIFMSVSGNNDYIKNYCAEKNYALDDNLLLMDLVEHERVPAYIDLADICIIPLPRLLWWEISSPLKLMEYLAMEKPIILSDIKAHTSVIPIDADYATYFNPDDPDDLSRKLLKTISNYSILKSNTAKGRKLILEKYTWDIQAKVIENFIQSI